MAGFADDGAGIRLCHTLWPATQASQDAYAATPATCTTWKSSSLAAITGAAVSSSRDALCRFLGLTDRIYVAAIACSIMAGATASSGLSIIGAACSSRNARATDARATGGLRAAAAAHASAIACSIMAGATASSGLSATDARARGGAACSSRNARATDARATGGLLAATAANVAAIAGSNVVATARSGHEHVAAIIGAACSSRNVSAIDARATGGLPAATAANVAGSNADATTGSNVDATAGSGLSQQRQYVAGTPSTTTCPTWAAIGLDGAAITGASVYVDRVAAISSAPHAMGAAVSTDGIGAAATATVPAPTSLGTEPGDRCLHELPVQRHAASGRERRHDNDNHVWVDSAKLQRVSIWPVTFPVFWTLPRAPTNRVGRT